MQRVFVSKYAFGHIFQRKCMYSHWCLHHILLMHP